jgi:adenylosuccinate lyase
MHAETTSFGVKMAGYVAELARHQERLRRAIAQAAVGKLSGAVGVYTSVSPQIEAEVCRRLELQPETIATQVIPRDRVGEVLCALALFGGFLERLAVELRHLQRTEVGEVVEDFTPGQKGSSAMPHKKNPISAENITGVSRLLRGYMLAGLENMALWHERDISHSSVERVILPDAFIIADYAAARLTDVLKRLHVNRDRMRSNMALSQGQLLSSQILLLMVKKGFSRDEAYSLVQEASHSLRNGENLLTRLARDPRVKKRVRSAELNALAKEATFKTRFNELVQRANRSASLTTSKHKKR